ncbi:capsule biosynthesis GfcC family protein [Pantoea sp. KPR_PJ]|uniref:capsule biosynthesis GfcC family protein n=1 Tax=Pantoea sp. KPR_PJ TaxID=2738375 RepID=UPI003527EC04
MKNTLSMLAAFMLAGSSAAWAAGQVTVHTARGSVTIDEVQDLAQLVTQPALIDTVWWRGAAIAERGASAVAAQQQQKTLADLHVWQSQSRGERAAAVAEVARQLSAVKVTGRQFVSLDPDWIRLHPDASRRLQGSYDLWLPPQSDSVWLMGALHGAGKVSWQPGETVRGYLAGHAALSGAENSYVTLISPEGKTQRVPVAYWNYRHVEVVPGSIIWLGFSSWSLPDGQDDLNQRMISILTHRVPE